MKRLNQKGFSHLEVILIILVIALIGGAGFYVLKQNAKPKVSTNNQTAAGDNSTASTDTNKLKEYKGDGYTLYYPSSWTMSDGQDNSVNFQSTDYEENRVVEYQRGTGHLTSAGYKLVVSDITANDPADTIEKSIAKVVSDEKATGSGTHKTIKVGGYDALWFNNGYEHTYLVTKVFHNGKITHIMLYAKDDSDQNTFKQLDDILATFKF